MVAVGMADDAKLAINGGAAVCRGMTWPAWPQFFGGERRALRSVLESGRWAISAPWNGHPLAERRFAKEFARFLKVRYCVPVSNGSAALRSALEACDIGYGDEVIIPGLTWVATASAVVSNNSIPVLVNIDPTTLCMDVGAVERAITVRTKAIIVVHLFGSMGDIDRLSELARKHKLSLIEDCAQAHGAAWRGRCAGTYGICGTFSMQHTKILTSGEGGAVVTNDARIADRLEQYRADSRRYSARAVRSGELELIEGGNILGTNYCLSEFQAALLLEQMTRLREQCHIRQRNAALLDAELATIEGVQPQGVPGGVTTRAVYQYAVRLETAAFAGKGLTSICSALSAELRLPVQRIYRPLNANPLYCPARNLRFAISSEHMNKLEPTRFQLPESQRAYEQCIAIHHRFLLSETKRMEAVGVAFQKVQRLANTIRS